MPYSILILPRAGRALRTLPENDAERIDAAIEGLAENPRPVGSKKLKGEEAYRIRVGDYRVVYSIDDNERIVLIADVGHRREIYR